MIDLQPAPVPDLSDTWIASRRATLVDVLSPKPRPATKWVVLPGAAGVAALVAALVLVGGSSRSTPGRVPPAPAQAIPYAFAGWSPSPTTATQVQASTANSVCRARLGQLRPSNKGTGAASLVPELHDVRGPYTVTVFGNGSPNAALCVSAPGATALRWIMRSPAPVPARGIAVDQISVLARAGQPYTLVEGRTGAAVTAVVLALGNGSRVTATSGDGIFLAWWPGSQRILTATVTTASGAFTQPLNLAGPGIPPAPKPAPAGGSPNPTGGGAGSATVHLG